MIRFGAVLIALLSTANPALGGDAQFIPGHLFVTEFGNEGCLQQRNWLREIDPNTGESWIIADAADGLCDPSGLCFTPRGDRLRVLNSGRADLLDVDAGGSSYLVLDRDDGIGTPLMRGGLPWDRRGNMYVSSGSRGTWRYPPDSTPGAQILNVWWGSLSFHPDGFLYGTGGRELIRMSTDGDFCVIDDYGCAPGCGAENHALCTAVDQRGNLFVAVDMRATGGALDIYRYDGTEPSTRRLLASGFIPFSAAMTLSPDETQLYLVTRFQIWVIDVNNGTPTELYRFSSGRYGGTGMAVYTPAKLGDLNCDDRVNNFDIDPFVLALTDAAGYQARYGWCDRSRADVNGDGSIDNFDIDAFVEAVVAGSAE